MLIWFLYYYFRANSLITIRGAIVHWDTKTNDWQSIDDGISRVDICSQKNRDGKESVKIVGISAVTLDVFYLFI